MKITRSIRIIRFALLALLCVPLYAGAWDRGDVTTFATLPHGGANPEGITVGPHGKFYVTTFNPLRETGVGEIFVFSSSGHFIRKVEVQDSSTALLDLAFHPTTGELLVLDFGNAQVLEVNPYNGMSTVFATLPLPSPSGAGLNVLTFDRAGNVYVSDSFLGVIWKTGPSGGVATSWVSDPKLTTSGVPPFGANGLAFNHDESAMFVANTGNDQIIKIPVSGGSAGTPEVFVNSINGADGLIIDKHDNLWVAANQEDEIVVLEPKDGRVIAKLGDFNGIRHGKVDGLLFPATLIRYGKYIYVTNLAFDLRLFGAPTIDSPWTAKVRKFTVSKLLARIPRMDDDHGRKDDDDDDDDRGNHKNKHDDGHDDNHHNKHD